MLKKEEVIGHYYYDFANNKEEYITHECYLKRQELAVRAGWDNLWDEVQKWYGDIKKMESEEMFLNRMKEKFDLKFKFDTHDLETNP